MIRLYYFILICETRNTVAFVENTNLKFAINPFRIYNCIYTLLNYCGWRKRLIKNTVTAVGKLDIHILICIRFVYRVNSIIVIILCITNSTQNRSVRYWLFKFRQNLTLWYSGVRIIFMITIQTNNTVSL